MNKRYEILRHNQACREGTNGQGPRRLDDGEVVFKIPTDDMKVLKTIYPDLVSKEHDVRLAAWKQFRTTPLAENYLVTRTPRQVKKSPGGVIIK